MKPLKKLLAALAIIVGVAMLLLSIGGGVGVWTVKGPLTDRTTHLFGRIQKALDLGEEGLDHVKTSLGNAAERLNDVRAEQRKLAQQPQNSSTVRRLMARTVQQRIAPEVDNAHQTTHAVAEAAVLVNSVLEDLGNLPFLSTTGLDSGRLTDLNKSLSTMESSAWELTRLLGETGSDEDADGQLSRMEQTLKTIQGLVVEYESQFRQIRERIDAAKAKFLSWITPAAVLISVVLIWIALSQISVLAHAWTWIRH